MAIPELMLRGTTGAEAALTRDLFDEYGRMVLVLCRALLRDWRDAEDAAQQTFLGAYRSILAGNRPSNPGAWLATIARNECRSRWERKQEQTAPLSEDLEAVHADPAEIAAAREDLSALAVALAALPERQREVVRLHCLDGLPYRDVAEKLEITSRAVDGLLLRARKRLRRYIARAGAIVVPAFIRDRLAQLPPGTEESAGAAAVASGGGAGAIAVASSTSMAAKIAAVSVGVAALGTAANQTPVQERHATHRPAHHARRLPAIPSEIASTSSRVSTLERRGRSGDDSRESGHDGHGSRESSGDGPSGGSGRSERDDATRSGPGSSGSERSGHSGSGRSESSESGSGNSGSRSPGSESSGSESSGSESPVSEGSSSSGSGESGHSGSD